MRLERDGGGLNSLNFGWMDGYEWACTVPKRERGLGVDGWSGNRISGIATPLKGD